MAGVQTRNVKPDEAELRLDRWFKRHFPALKHGRLEKLLRTGQVRVDGKRAEAGTRLEAGQVIRIPPIDPTGERPAPAHGRPVSAADLAGGPVLLYFGYTFCPDVCPLTLAELKQIKALLGPNAADVAVLYISVDPERDSPEVLKRYIGAFDPDFLSATGDIETVRRFATEFGAAFEKQKPAGTSASYLVAHTSFTYLLDRDGRWRMTFAFKTPVEEVARETLRIAQER